LPSYYRDYSGFIISAAIDRYVYVTLHRPFSGELILKYSKTERPETVEQIQHPIIREALKLLEFPERPSLEIASMADIPAGTGLGSSGSFTTALLKALHAYRKSVVLPHTLAEEACHIEIERLGEPVGKQDQYIAAYGGLTCFRFMPDGRVEASPLRLSEQTIYDLEDGLLLFYTGISSSSATLLADQDTRSKQRDSAMIQNLHQVKEMGLATRTALEAGDLAGFAQIMNEHWARKKERSAGMSNPQIDAWYELAMKNGALGGKLIGAGGRGFLMFYAHDKSRVRHALSEAGMTEVRFHFDFDGTKVLTHL
jgi:D-glycero-alpha-D-manno-heptose-7-phosphate kinase